ncbi:hypothetical protein L596_016143 [Steinernema carpocapsae]|uniref:Uncharacterized protein n=1 Tax=Steinernema carpocapsae TaxID=34508 RepID=A0A4U5NI34_STECR|nr:hypothetical protein L596_016143 [Steinernema carpocapsae]
MPHFDQNDAQELFRKARIRKVAPKMPGKQHKRSSAIFKKQIPSHKARKAVKRHKKLKMTTDKISQTQEKVQKSTKT